MEDLELINKIGNRSSPVEETDIQEKRITVSFISDAEVFRHDEYEVLDVNNIDMSFAQSGNAPFLLEHDYENPEAHVGVVEKAWIENGRGKAIVRLSADEEKQGIIGDILSGIRPNISCRYKYLTRTQVGEKNGLPINKYSVKILEISSVAIPADESVGTNRSAEIIETTPIKETQKMDTNKETETKTIDVDAVRSAAIKEANQRATDINTLCNKFGLAERAIDFISSDKSLLDIKEEVFAIVEKRNADIETSAQPVDAIKTGAPAVHTNTKHEFDNDKAFRAALSKDWSKAGFEREMCQERAMQSDGLLRYDQNVVILDPKQRAGVTAGTAGSGAELVGTQYRPDKLIDALWNQTWLNKVGTDTMLGLVGNTVIPVISSNATTNWVSETGNLPTAQGLTTGSKDISPKQMVAKFEMTRQSLIQNVPDVQTKILGQLYQAIAQSLDAAAYNGVVSPALSTTGLKNEITSIVSFGADGGDATSAKFGEFRKALIANKINVDKAKWVMSSALRETLANTLKDSANANSGYILPYDAQTLNGLPFVNSQNIPSNGTEGTGTNLNTIILGDWSEFLVAQWGHIAVEFDYVTGADNSKVYIRSFSFWDMLIKRIEAFAMANDVK